jgi:hypothetical protein
LLAIDVNDNASCLNDRVAQPFFASRLAPTGDWFYSGPVATEDPCRSELARDEPWDDAFIQQARVIVDVHREQARSYRSKINDQRTPALRRADGVKSASL